MKEITLNPQKTALVVIDLQKGIVNRNWQDFDCNAVVDNAAQLASAFRQAKAFVTLVRVEYFDGKDALKPITDQSIPASELPKGWAELVPELNKQPSDFVITKRQWGAFFGTELDLQLRRRGIDTIVLCGISTNIGVETTAREAFQHGYNQIFAIDAMACASKEEHDHTAKFIFSRVGQIRSTAEILNGLQQQS